MENIDSDLIRGNIDTIILKTLLFEDKYGLDIIKEIETRSNGTYELKQPTLYSCLKRLENQKLIESYWVDSEIGGRRHYYKLTQKGRDFYNQKQEEWSKSKFIIDNLLSNFNSDEYRLVKKDDYDKIIEGKTFEYDSPAQAESEPTSETESETEFDGAEGEDELDGAEDEAELDGAEDEAELDGADTDELDEDESENELSENEDESELEYAQSESLDQTSEEDATEETDSATAFQSQPDPSRKYYIDNFDDDEQTSQVKFEDVYNNEDNTEDTESDEEEPIQLNEDEEPDEQGEELDEQSEESAELANSSDNEESEEIKEPGGAPEIRWTRSEEYSYNEVRDDGEEMAESEETEEPREYAQNQMFDDEAEEDDEYLKKINAFSSAAKNLQNFDSSGETSEPEEENFEQLEDKTISLLDYDEDYKFDETAKNIYPYPEDEADEPVTQDLEEYSFNGNTEENTEEADNFDYNSYLAVDEDEQEEELADPSVTAKNEELQDDFFDDLDELSNSRVSTFVSAKDNLGYDEIKKNEEEASLEDIEAENELEEPEISENVGDEQPESEAYEEQEADYSNTYIQSESTESDDKIYNLNSDDSYNNITNYSYDYSSYKDPVIERGENYSQTTMFEQNTNSEPAFTPQYTSESYKQKLSTLTEYSNAGADERKDSSASGSEENLEKVKDIELLKAEFGEQGIKVKEYKKYATNGDDKTYVLINKLNLVSSLILLFGYMFLLSAVYIILNNTSLKTMPNFSFLYFLYGFIPFAVFAIYHVIRFAISPYKKVPAKISVPITMFIALIVTVQLLLITYCVNLQLGFYSFTQTEYNHLLWIIPLFISFAPLIYNAIYVALFYSKNFHS